MRTAERMTETEQVHRLSENLISHLTKGREWATPGVQAALQRAVAGLDTGIESASPRLQVLLRRLALIAAGVGVWRSAKTSGDESQPSLTVPEADDAGPETDADLAAGRI